MCIGLLAKRVSLDVQVSNSLLNMIDKKVRNARSYHRFFFFLQEIYRSLFIAFFIASMHTHAQEICYYDDLLCFFFCLYLSFSAVQLKGMCVRIQGLSNDEPHLILCMRTPEIVNEYYRLFLLFSVFLLSAVKQLTEIGCRIVFSYSCRLRDESKMFIEECLLDLLTQVGAGQ